MTRLSGVHLIAGPPRITDADGAWTAAKAGAVALGRTGARVAPAPRIHGSRQRPPRCDPSRLASPNVAA